MKTKHIILTLASLIALSACGSDDSVPPENIGKTTQALNAVTTYIQNMQTGPVGWWRLNEIPTVGGTAADSSGKNHPGTYNGGSATTSVPGSTASDPADTAVLFSNTALSYVNIPDNDDLSLVKNEDSFDRVVAYGNTWGSQPYPGHGDVWQQSHQGANNCFSVNYSQGIISETVAGYWGQWLSAATKYKNTDIQVKGAWGATPVGSAIPFAIQARASNVSNMYRAEAFTVTTGGTLYLRVVKIVGGIKTTIGSSATLGSSASGAWWNMRMSLENIPNPTAPPSETVNIKVKSWKDGTVQPGWTIDVNDTSFPNSGTVGVFSANASGGVQTVIFDDFRVQSVGMTVHTRFKPSTLTFTGHTGGICNNNTGTPQNYVPILNKSGTDAEWLFRFYPDTAYDFTTCTNYRANRLSAYIFKQAGGLGSGSFCQPFVNPLDPGDYCKDSSGSDILSTPTNILDTNTWHSMLAVYEPGDNKDTLARSHLFIDGKEETSNGISGQLYSGASYSVLPHNGISPFRIGGAGTSTTQFRGSLDEVMIFDRMLSATEISDLHNSFTSP